MVYGLSPRRRRLLFAVAGVALFGGAVLLVLLLRDEPLDRSRLPVVLVHGYGSSADSMSVLASALRGEGREVTAVELPQRGEGDLADSARALAEAVDQTGAARVDLVGHSAGGVVIRSYLKDLGGITRVGRVVTLGSPHHGTELSEAAAAVGSGECIDACAQLTPSSSFLQDLNAGDETPGRVSYTSVWTSVDAVVTPPDSAVLDGANNVRVQGVCAASRMNHGDLVRDPLAVAIVITSLSGSDGVPGAADCDALTALGRDALSS